MQQNKVVTIGKYDSEKNMSINMKHNIEHLKELKYLTMFDPI